MVAQWLWQTKSVCSQGKKARNLRSYVSQPTIFFQLCICLETVQLISIDLVFYFMLPYLEFKFYAIPWLS